MNSKNAVCFILFFLMGYYYKYGIPPRISNYFFYYRCASKIKNKFNNSVRDTAKVLAHFER